MFKNQEGRHLPQLPVSQEYGQVFQNEHEEITSNAEGNFGEHRVGVRVPESKPGAQGLPDVHHQDRHGAAIANQAHHDRAVQDGFEVFLLEDVNEEAGEEGAGAHGDHSQIQDRSTFRRRSDCPYGSGSGRSINRVRPHKFPGRAGQPRERARDMNRIVEVRSTPRAIKRRSITSKSAMLGLRGAI